MIRALKKSEMGFLEAPVPELCLQRSFTLPELCVVSKILIFDAAKLGVGVLDVVHS